MSENTKGKDHSFFILAIVAVVAIVAITICFLATQGFNFSGTMEKEKTEVTAYNSNLSQNNTDM